MNQQKQEAFKFLKFHLSNRWPFSLPSWISPIFRSNIKMPEALSLEWLTINNWQLWTFQVENRIEFDFIRSLKLVVEISSLFRWNAFKRELFFQFELFSTWNGEPNALRRSPKFEVQTVGDCNWIKIFDLPQFILLVAQQTSCAGMFLSENFSLQTALSTSEDREPEKSWAQISAR